jgi:hypothetical protein
MGVYDGAYGYVDAKQQRCRMEGYMRLQREREAFVRDYEASIRDHERRQQRVKEVFRGNLTSEPIEDKGEQVTKLLPAPKMVSYHDKD